MAEAQVSGREGGVGGVREILKEQKVPHWLSCKKPRPFIKCFFLNNAANVLFFPLTFAACVLQAFVEVCIKNNNRYEAKKYISKVTPEQKVKAHLAVR